MKSRKERVPLSTRILSRTRDVLKKSAKENKLSLAELTANVMDDYADWLANENKGKKND